MRIVDLTAELRTGLPVYPGDPPVRIEPVATIERDGYAVARLELSDQAGTHVETQAHFLPGGRALSDEPLERFISRTTVVDVPCRRLAIADLAPAADHIARHPALLLRSDFAASTTGINPTDPCRPRLPLDLLGWLVDRGIRLLGIDAFDFDADPHHARHRFLLSRGVLIVEGLVNLEALTDSEGNLVRRATSLARDRRRTVSRLRSPRPAANRQLAPPGARHIARRDPGGAANCGPRGVRCALVLYLLCTRGRPRPANRCCRSPAPRPAPRLAGNLNLAVAHRGPEVAPGGLRMPLLPLAK